MPNSIFYRRSVSSASSKTILLSTLVVSLFVASSWNLFSFSKINIHIGDVHHSPTSVSTTATSDTSTVSTSSEQALETTSTTTTSDPSSPSHDALNPLSTIEAGIKEIATAGIDPFSIALVNPEMKIKQSELEKFLPFYQLLIKQNKDITITVPPKPVVDPTMAGGFGGIGAIPVIPNPINTIKLSGISYMPKRSFAMLTIPGEDDPAIVAQGEVITVGGQSVKVVSIARGTVSLSWLGAPKGVTATQQLDIPDIIGFGSKDSSSSDTSNDTNNPTAGANNTPEAIENLVNAAMKP